MENLALPAAASRPKDPAPRLARTTFATSRLLDFASTKELVAQTGHSVEDWPLVVLKELLDNALDACEEAGTPPVLHVTVDGEGITVADNGPGIPMETIHGVLDYAVRVSSREAYVSPTRGAQGNALKTILAMPFVLSESLGRVDILTGGSRHAITFRVDPIRQQPALSRETTTDETVKNGTAIKVHWPDSARSLLECAEERILQLVVDYGALNPHASLVVDWRDRWQGQVEASQPDWPHWLPSDLTSPHWYGCEEFERLVCAYLAHDQERGTDRSVREVVREFRGLRGTAKQRAILEATGLARVNLSALGREEGLDRDALERLLKAMCEQSAPVKPAALGSLGEKHIASRFRELGGEMATFQYRRAAKVDEQGMPFVLEVAFACMADEARSRRLITGINWSPAIRNPFRYLQAGHLDGLLQEQRAGWREPVALLVHLACPRVRYTDRGKSAVILGPVKGECIEKLVRQVTAKWAAARKAEERDSKRTARRHELLAGRDDRRPSVKEAAWEVMETAYLAASSGGTLPAHARQVMYAARGQIQELTGRTLDDRYFTQTLLPDYLAENPETTATWDVVFDARGHFEEPHTGRAVPLGTLEVRQYLKGVEQQAPPSFARYFRASEGDLLPTVGPENRFGALLFMEKEGFWPLFRAVRLVERFDLAVMSTKGVSVTASRRLAETICSTYQIPLLVLRDFDKAGFTIAATFRRDTRRYSFEHDFSVVDLGLRLPDVRDWHLTPETVAYGCTKQGVPNDPRSNLQANGATKKEIVFLCGDEPQAGGYVGQRVELNAFASAQLIEWLEAKLTKHGVKKVVPDAATMAVAYQRALQASLVQDRMEQALREAETEARAVPVPENLAEEVQRRLQANPALPWDVAVNQVVAETRRAG